MTFSEAQALMDICMVHFGPGSKLHQTLTYKADLRYTWPGDGRKTWKIGNPWKKSYGNHMEIPKVGDKQMIKKHNCSSFFSWIWDKTHDFPRDFLLKQSVMTSLVDLCWRWRSLNGCDSSSVSIGQFFFRPRIYGIFVVGYFLGVNQPPK